jgi:tRNA (mo5U34)-methyltransferase
MSQLRAAAVSGAEQNDAAAPRASLRGFSKAESKTSKVLHLIALVSYEIARLLFPFMDLIPRLDIRRTQLLKPEYREVIDAFLKEEIPRRNWYHRMDLGNGVTTPGLPWEVLWDNTRQARKEIDYANKTVLDLGSWDGMWAFEAEMLGAAFVVATDCMNYWQLPWHRGMDNLLLVREAIFSKVVPLWNLSPYVLRERLDNMLYSHALLKDGFDIVQHLGLLYHLRDPLLSLAQARSVIKDGGILLLETALCGNGDSCMMRFNFGPGAFYNDFTSWWAPTLSCLREMLRTSLFEMDEDGAAFQYTDSPVCRVALRARALPPSNAVGEHYKLDPAFGHGFGEQLISRLAPPDAAALWNWASKRD